MTDTKAKWPKETPLQEAVRNDVYHCLRTYSVQTLLASSPDCWENGSFDREEYLGNVRSLLFTLDIMGVTRAP
jgi:hypothetical protein